MDKIDFAKGALMGGCVGSMLALLLAPKSGQDLREDIVEGYHSLCDQSQEYAGDVKSSTQELMDSLHEWEGGHYPPLLVGGMAGAIIGALAGLLLAPQSGSELRTKLGDEYEEIYEKAQEFVDGMHQKKDALGDKLEDKLEDWKDIFATIVDKLTSKTSKKTPSKGGGLDGIWNWANLGLRLYNQLQARRS
ncbi:MAG: YtxH domain-containing protein [Parachlamydiaceae bacterium]